VGVGVGVGVAVGVTVAVGVGEIVPVTVKISVPVRACKSGFVIVTSLAPVEAPVVFKFRVRCVGSVNVTELTTIPPVTVAAIRFVKPGPGS
jgi:hypothetical protein